MNYVFVPPSIDEYNGVSVKGKPTGIEFSDADIRRGYSLAKKQLGLAYLIESVIITACLFAGWQFAERYASGGEPVQFWLAGWTGLQHSQAWWSAILGSCTIAAAELARVPLAQVAGRHSSRFVRMVIALALVGMVLVTAKSLAQVAEQQFSPQLHEIRETHGALRKAQADAAVVKSSRVATEGASTQIDETVKRLDAEIAALTSRLEQFGTPPKAYRVQRGWSAPDKRGRRLPIYTWVTPAWEGTTIVKQIHEARQRRDQVLAEAKAGRQKVAGIDGDAAQAETIVAAKQADYRAAISNSQLHSFTAMVLGRDPVDVSDGEVHWFLRFFIVLPSILVASATTMLAWCAYTRHPQPKRKSKPSPPPVEAVASDTLARHVTAIARRAVEYRFTEGAHA